MLLVNSGFIPQGVVFCPHSPAGHIGSPAFKSYVCKHPWHEEQGFLFTKEMLKQTKTGYKLENVSAKRNVSIRKVEQLSPGYDLKAYMQFYTWLLKVHRISFSDFCLMLRELHAAADMD